MRPCAKYCLRQPEMRQSPLQLCNWPPALTTASSALPPKGACSRSGCALAAQATAARVAPRRCLNASSTHCTCRHLLCALLQATAAAAKLAELTGEDDGAADRSFTVDWLHVVATSISALLPAQGYDAGADPAGASRFACNGAAPPGERQLASELERLLQQLFGSDAAAVQQLLERQLPPSPGQEPPGRLPPDVAVVGAHALACRTACAHLGCTSLLHDRDPPRGSKCSQCRLLRFCSECCRNADWAARLIGIHRSACRPLAA